MRPLLLALGLLTASAMLWPAVLHAEPQHGIAMHGEPTLPADFQHLPYANPDAPVGGDLTLGALGSFDSLNPFIVKGNAPLTLRATNYVFERLLGRNYDEPFGLYGLLAESVETPEDRSWVEFQLRPEAKFSDGEPVTVDDVIFSWETLRERGRPNFRSSYGKVERVERVGERGVRFVFGPERDRELPLILGLMPILPKHVYEGERFDQASLETPVGSGPYLVDEVKPGQRLTYRRNPDYWGWSVPVNRGHYNFDTLAIEYFRDNNALFEAFKKGIIGLRYEGDPMRWATGYDFPAVQSGRVLKKTFKTGVPVPLDAFVFNTRRPIFADPRVREALLLAFDFEWVNKNLYHGLYDRLQSYFHGSELSSHGRAADAHERTLLASLLDQMPPELLDGSFGMPQSEGRGRNRENMREALRLLSEAGWTLKDGVLRDAAGNPFTFEILVVSRDQERIALAFTRGLERLGIQARVRQVDAAQYEQRKQTFDFDMIENIWYPSLSPGNEQNLYWSSAAAEAEGSRNYMGVAEPAIDASINALLDAEDREDFVSAVRALDRVLLSGTYVIPLFGTAEQWVAHWAEFDHPQEPSLYGMPIEIWWKKPQQ